MNQKTWAAAVVTFAMGALALGCQSGGIGDPCTPEDEYQQYFGGYAVTEINLESRSFQCETRLCLVNHFQGRVSCPYGQTDPTVGGGSTPENERCHVPGTSGSENLIQVPVNKQYTGRSPTNSVYCSCRCSGADPNGRYCKCPTGFQCVQLLDPVDRLGAKELAGAYCVKDGTEYKEGVTDKGTTCSVTDHNAVPPEPPGDCGLFDGPIY